MTTKMTVEYFLNYVKNTKSNNTYREYKRGIEAFCEWYGKTPNEVLEERRQDWISGDLVRKKRFTRELEKFHKWLTEPVHTIRGKPNQAYSINSARTYCLGIRQLFRFYEMPLMIPTGSEITKTVVSTKDFVPTSDQYRKMFNVAGDLIAILPMLRMHIKMVAATLGEKGLSGVLSSLGATLPTLTALGATFSWFYFMFEAFRGTIKPTTEEIARFNKEVGELYLDPAVESLAEFDEQLKHIDERFMEVGEHGWRRSFFPELIQWSERASQSLRDFYQLSTPIIGLGRGRGTPSLRTINVHQSIGTVTSDVDTRRLAEETYRTLMRKLERYA